MPSGDDHDPYRGLRGGGDSGPTAEQTALVVVDMQNCFVHPQGAFSRLGADVTCLTAAIPGCRALVEGARAAKLPVVFVRHVLRPDCLDGGIIFNELKRPVRDVGAIMRGTWDAKIVDELVPEPEDFLVEKRRFSAFYGTDLEVILSSLRITSLVICGVTTNICVESTARDAAQRDYRTYVVSDATGEIDAVKHEHALSTLAYAFCRVVSVDDVLGTWSSAGVPALS